MKVVKVRRVGNSNVISIPREFEAQGYAPGSSVLVEELPGGELRVMSTEKVRDRIRDIGGRLVAEHGEALEILANHDPRPAAIRLMAEGRSGEFEPVYLTLADVLELHGLIIGATATEAADQLRNRAGLESALARPETYAHYQDAAWHSKRLCWRTGSPRASSSSTGTSARR